MWQTDTKVYFCGMDVSDFLHNGHKSYLPNLSLDHVILGYEEGQLKCLLLQTNERWNLPGGLIKRTESVEEAVDRVLQERTGLSHGHREFLSVFGKQDRSFAQQWKQMLESYKLEWKPEFWINDRFVTLGYYSLVNIRDVEPVKGEYNQDIAWFSLQDLPEMWMDHKDIALFAHEKLKRDIKEQMASHYLLNSEFTMPELHQLHQTILEQELDRSRFQKKMLSSGKFERLPQKKTDKPGRSPFQYRAK